MYSKKFKKKIYLSSSKVKFNRFYYKKEHKADIKLPPFCLFLKGNGFPKNDFSGGLPFKIGNQKN